MTSFMVNEKGNKSVNNLAKKISNRKNHTRYVIWRFIVVVVIRTSQMFENQGPETFDEN